MTFTEMEQTIKKIEHFLKEKWALEDKIFSFGENSENLTDETVENINKLTAICEKALSFLLNIAENYRVFAAKVTNLTLDDSNNELVKIFINPIDYEVKNSNNNFLFIAKNDLLEKTGFTQLDQCIGNVYFTFGIIDSDKGKQLHALKITTKLDDAQLFTLDGLMKEFSLNIGNN